jgi:small subunit ribosomal protein S15
MYLTPEIKKDLFKKFGESEFDTGSPEGQIALFTHRIKRLTEHMKENKKDKFTERALVQLVSKRRKQLNYLRNTDIQRYRAIIAELKLRK